MAKKAPAKKSEPSPSLPERKVRNFPKHTLMATLPVAQKIQDENGGKPLNRLLLAEALGLSPSSSNFREILSSAYKYGLTEGTEKAEVISLTPLGDQATGSDESKHLASRRAAVLKSPVFGQFYRDFANRKVPSQEMLPRVLNATYSVPHELTAECATLIDQNGRFVSFIRDIGGSPHILLDAQATKDEQSLRESDEDSEQDDAAPEELAGKDEEQPPPATLQPPSMNEASRAHKPIFVAHGKNRVPLQQLQGLLTAFQIPHKVVVDEANLGRPISQKVRDTLHECGSAILIFTRDEQMRDKDGNEVWRPSENVVYELGATSYLYGDRIVIFKEKGIHFPTNFQNIGYIEFESNDIQARTADLLKELIGFGLVRVTPT